LAIDQNEAWSEVRKYNSDIEKKYSVVLSKLQPKTSEQKMADGGIMADGGEVLEKYSVTKKPDENLFLYIIYTESGEKVPSKLLPKDIGYGKIENKFEAKRRKYDPSLGLRDAQDIVRVMNKREQGKMADGGKVKDQYKIPSTEQMVEMVMREKDKAIQRNKELGIRVVIGRYDGYGATLANGEYIETILASRPSRRKVIEIIESNPEIIEVFFLGTIRGAMRVGEEMDFLDDFLVNLWKKPIEPNKAIGITFQWTDTKQDPKNPNKEIRADEGIYMIVNQEDAHLYKDRPTDDTYLYVNDYNEKNGEKSTMRIPKSDFQRLEEEGAIEIIKVSKAIQEELLKPMPIYADGGMIGFENTKKLIEEIKKHSDYSQGTISTTKNGEKYRYDHWKLSHKHASDWMIRLFEKASKENTGLEYNNEFIFGDNYSFSYARPQFKGQPNGKIGMSQLILLDGAIANDGIMVNSKKLGK